MLIFFAIGFALMGCTYGPLGAAHGAAVPDGGALYRRVDGLQPGGHPRRVAGALCRARSWRKTYGLGAVGLYLTGAAVLTTLALWAMTRLKNEEGDGGA